MIVKTKRHSSGEPSRSQKNARDTPASTYESANTNTRANLTNNEKCNSSQNKTQLRTTIPNSNNDNHLVNEENSRKRRSTEAQGIKPRIALKCIIANKICMTRVIILAYFVIYFRSYCESKFYGKRTQK